jgi:hypothetical protein
MKIQKYATVHLLSLGENFELTDAFEYVGDEESKRKKVTKKLVEKYSKLGKLKSFRYIASGQNTENAVYYDGNFILEDIEDIYPGLTDQLKRGDIIENVDQSGYRSEGVYMIDLIGGKFIMVSQNFDVDEYGTPNKNFIGLEEFPLNFWDDNNININKIFEPTHEKNFTWHQHVNGPVFYKPTNLPFIKIPNTEFSYQISRVNDIKKLIIRYDEEDEDEDDENENYLIPVPVSLDSQDILASNSSGDNYIDEYVDFEGDSPSEFLINLIKSENLSISYVGLIN